MAFVLSLTHLISGMKVNPRQAAVVINGELLHSSFRVRSR